MAFNPNPPKAEYQATAGQTNFPFLFKIYFTSDIKVYHTPISTGETVLLTEGIGYSVAINGDDGGTVTLILVVENNDYIVLERELELTRYVEYQTSGDLLAVTINADQDYQTYLTSDQNSLRENSLYLPQGTFGVDTELPFPIAGYFFKWSADGKSVEYGAPSTVTLPWGNIFGTLTDQTDLAAALNERIATNNGTFTGDLTGDINDSIIVSKELRLAGDYKLSGGSGYLVVQDENASSNVLTVNPNSRTLGLTADYLTWASKNVVVEDAYATSTDGGTIKILVVGSDCYITTDGSTPGP